MKSKTQTPSEISRRHFLKASSTASLAGALTTHFIFPEKLYPANSDTLRVGLIGCGGRGTGAASEALNADKNIILTAMADAFEDRLHSSLETLKELAPERVQVEPDRCFSEIGRAHV